MPRPTRVFVALLALHLSLAPALAQEEGAGAYLAAVVATRDGAFEAGARYYAAGLAEAPGNPVMAQGAMVTHVAIGDVAGAVAFAETMAALGARDEFSGTLVPVSAMVSGDFEAALAALDDETLTQNPMLNQLLSGWAAIGAGQFGDGVARFEALNTTSGLRGVSAYHQALANAYVGDFESAARLYQAAGEAAYVSRGAVLAHAQILATLEDYEGARLLMTRGAGARINDAEANALRRNVIAGAPVSFDRVASPLDGAAEALMLMAEALRNDDALRLSLFFARLAAYLNPARDDVAVLIGDILVGKGQNALALAAYNAVDDDAPLALVALAGKAGVLEAQGEIDAAIEVLQDAIATQGEVPSLLNMLGDGLRRAARFGEAVEVYSRAIAALDNPEAPSAWSLYYARATALEREDRWPEAEADLRLALQLSPEQPLVLNMLGYSLVDRGLALEEALGMIERAMEQRPDDGYITDSLGWAYYRMGRYDEAVSVMLDAVLLRPGDGILNDHYGDVLWMVGREREAAFQWQRALDSRSTDIDRPRIEAKLERGLDAVLEEEGNGNQ